MAIDPVFHGYINEGKLHVNMREAFRIHLARLEGRPVDIVVRLQKKKRSNQQNRYYWPVIVGMISEHTGHTPDEIHEFLKVRFNPYWIEIDGEKTRVGLSTTELSTVQMEEYQSRIRTWAGTELGLYIPVPNECESS